MAYPRKIRNFNAFVDGVGYFGKVLEGALPKLNIKTAPHRGGGMDGSVGVDMGMEAMTAEVTFSEWSPELITHFGKRVRMTFRAGAMGEDDFDTDAYAFEVGGRCTVVEGDNLKSGDDVNLKLGWECDFFRVEREGETLVEIDVENGVRNIGGEDQMRSMRAALGE